MTIQVWSRPWAQLDQSGKFWREAQTSQRIAVRLEAAATWLRTGGPDGPMLDGRPRCCQLETTLAGGDAVHSLPLPLRHGLVVASHPSGGALLLDSADLPERPPENLDPAGDEQKQAKVLLDRVKSVWARLREVEAALSDPARIWVRLGELWLAASVAADPEMDVIVRHARRMRRTIEALDRAPRRMLRRTRQMIPLSRVQEVDRKTMTWLTRQPGETIAERAGDRQRIQAVAREENFNTLENRVLLSYAHLAHEVARDYRDRHRAASSSRVQRVHGFGQRCAELERDLRERGVAPASADATPNFVLQNNSNYHQVWTSWHELLKRQRVLDELWRWQARSWEEFCALAVVVALQALDGARPLAVSPIVYSEEQAQGCWIKHVNPLAVLYLSKQSAIVEVSYRFRGGAVLAPFGAPIWLRFGRLDDPGFLRRLAIWPLWHARGGLEPDEPNEITKLLPSGKGQQVRGGATIRPTATGGTAETAITADAASFTLGAEGEALRDGLANLGAYFSACAQLIAQ